MSEELLLRANNFDANYKKCFANFLESETLVDVTLVCNDGKISAHKVILCAHSPLLHQILQTPSHAHLLLYLKGISISHLSSVIHFIYNGEVRVSKDSIQMFLDTAKELQIEGLVNYEDADKDKNVDSCEQKLSTIKTELESSTELMQACPSFAEDDTSSITEDESLLEVNTYNMKRAHKGSTGGRLLRNPVWDYFVRMEGNSGCSTCGFTLVGHNTSSLIKHLENRHPAVHAEYREKYRIAWSQKMSQPRPLPTSSCTDRPTLTRVKGRLNKNPVHDFFTRLEAHSHCNYCPTKLLGHNPTSLSKHLEAHHMDQYIEFRELYRQAWEDKRKIMRQKNVILAQRQDECSEHLNDTFEIDYNEDNFFVKTDKDNESSCISWDTCTEENTVQE